MDGIHSIPAAGPFYSNPSSSDALRQKPTQANKTQDLTAESVLSPDERHILLDLNTKLDQRLEYRFSRELNQVIIKIIDRDTDTVIKELPSTEFQRVHLAIREFIGHLIDKKV